MIPPTPGARVGPYEVLREIGRGATAIVVLARTEDGEEVAVKLRPRGVPAADRRFLREFESMRALRLPGVVRVFEAGLDPKHVWFSMEYVDGVSFLDAVEDLTGSARVDRVLDLSCQLLDVLGRLHSAGLAHRDVKPSNVLVDRRGRVRVLDFGIGRFFDSTAAHGGEGEGTLRYMAPEQLAGLSGDARVDLFATGLMLHEALSGPRPAPANPLGWVTRTCLERPRALATLAPTVPRRLSHVVERLLDVDPLARPEATEAAAALRQVRSEADSMDWPEPPFVDPGPAWTQLVEAFERSDAIIVLQGAAGSGRRRLVEQLQRQALLDGVRTLHVRCDLTSVGGPLCDALERVLRSGEDEAWARRIVAGSGGTLRQMWPHLPVPPTEDTEPVPTMTRVAEAAAGTLARAAAALDLMLVLHDLEQVDVLTARAVHRLAVLSDGALRLVLVHDPRWSTARSERMLAGLDARTTVATVEVAAVDAEVGQGILRGVCAPDTAPEAPGRANPQRIAESGYQALARSRREAWTAPGAHLWPLAVHQPLPTGVLTDLVGERVLHSPWIREQDGRVSLAGGTALRAARSRLADQATAARAVAEAWIAREGDASDPESLARLHLLAGQPDASRPFVRDAALRALSRGRYGTARRWLFLLDTLPGRRGAEPFELAAAKARVALVTESDEPRDLLVDGVEAAARSAEEHATATLLRAAYQLRQGQVRPALAEALRAASPSRAPSPRHAVEALVLATRCRLRLGQPDDAQAQLTRAEALLAALDEADLSTEVALLRAEVLLRSEELDAAGAQSEALLVDARRRDQRHHEARAALCLARVLRLAGRRARAESLARSARAAAERTADLTLLAEVQLFLAALLVERGDAAGARTLLDGLIREIRSLRMDHRMSGALRVVLLVALAEADPHAADVALGGFRAGRADDAEVPASLVRWHRSRGDLQAALGVASPPLSAHERWAGLLFRLEQARARLLAGERPAVSREARDVARLASERGFEELELYGRLLGDAADDVEDARWSRTCGEALASVWTELCFGALELDARRREAAGDAEGARARWSTLRARCEELGYRPGYEEASAWLETP